MSDYQPTLPLAFLSAFGQRASDILPLTLGLLFISITVVIIVSVLLLWGILRRRAHAQEIPRISRSGNGVIWIAVGVGLSSIVLFGVVVWTMQTLAAVSTPASEPAFTIAIDARQWWWQVSYQETESRRPFITANEVRIPAGQTVRFELTSSDVIHSFWIPALAGKTDLIPGRRNVTWLHADSPGVYRGQCMEYCGMQHARMGFVVVAMEPAAFDDWWQQQLTPAQPVNEQNLLEGQRLFQAQCAACHTIRGIGAGGRAGPELTHFASRRSLGAGLLPVTRETTGYWINNNQTIKPGNHMAEFSLDDRELDLVSDYLMTLE